MAKNDLTAADSLIAQVKALNAKYGMFYMGDTPAKAQRDLEKKRAAIATTKPSQLFAPGNSNRNKTPGNDPFAGQTTNQAATAAGVAGSPQITPLPQVDSTMPNSPVRSPLYSSSAAPLPAVDSPYAAGPSRQNELRSSQVGATVNGNVNGNAPGAARTAENPLRAARLALADTDVRTAGMHVQRARNMQLTYQPSDDTPDKVEAAIRSYLELSGLDKNTEAYAHKYARSLTEQADGLMRWGAYDKAEELARRAAVIPIMYNPAEQKPQEVLARIAAARRQNSEAGYATASAGPSATANQQGVELLRQARNAISEGQYDRAESLARQAEALRLPASAYGRNGDQPALVLFDLRQLQRRSATAGGSAVMPASANAVIPAGGYGAYDRTAASAVYNPANDPTHIVAASSQQAVSGSSQRYAANGEQSPPAPIPAAMPTEPVATPQGTGTTQGMALYQQAEGAAKANDIARANELFRQAAVHMNELDPETQQRLRAHLMYSAPARNASPNPNASVAEQEAAQQQIFIQKVRADLAQRESSARALRQNGDPIGALDILKKARQDVEGSGLDAATREKLLASIDRATAETEQIITQNRPQLELAARNKQVLRDYDREQKVRVEVQDKVALLIDQQRKLLDEQRYEEAELVAKQAVDLDPKNPVTNQALWYARFTRRFADSKAIESAKEDAFVRNLNDVERTDIPFNPSQGFMQFGQDAKGWADLTKRRQKFGPEARQPRLEKDIEIEQKLNTPVSMRFQNEPLSKVIDNLAKCVGINVQIDPKGLADEGVTSDTPVTINLSSDIMMKSALNLILTPLHLSYVVKNEVLNITSEQARDSQLVTVTYNVPDLVIPIPNFVPTAAMGLAGAYVNAMATASPGGGMPFGSNTASPLSALAANSHGNVNAAGVLCQQQLPGLLHATSSSGNGTKTGQSPSNSAGGPGGLNGGSQADFDSLIDLIETTIKPNSWQDNGGPGSISPFETNLSLVISQTQEVHEEVADLLKQLRRMQDLQVTIEVRFITLNDNFFERIGVNFDFTIKDNVTAAGVNSVGAVNPNTLTTLSGANIDVSKADGSQTQVVGLGTANTYSSDLNIPVTSGSYGLALPQFGGFDASAGTQVGFAILSNIEAYFFITAAQGDKRTNVLQAPRVTLFNGQQAFVSDTTQVPFVISVIPVVGDFAAAQQPVIVVLNEGTAMTVQAVVSPDRRFVRLTVVPFFSNVTSVSTFTFAGSTTTTTNSTRAGLLPAATDPSKLWNNTSDATTSSTSGTTVQLPSFAYTTVSTTVSVPDGGTILLGGIKRLNEGRNEYGTPILDKLPYINRLFKNVGIGRETQSLMMMVTPRIIIQEEEEANLGVTVPNS
jgi:general secretion pathway protein D